MVAGFQRVSYAGLPMRKIYLLPVFLAVSLIGAGCSGKTAPSGTPEGVPAGPKPATFESLSPAEAAKKINFTAGNILVMKQSFSGSGTEIAEELGWGKELTRTIVIRRFAPKNRADVEWKISTEGATGTKQYVGAVLDGRLTNSPDILSPSLWTEGEKNALGSSLIWLSSDVFENFSRSKSSVLRIDLDELPAQLELTKDPYVKGINALKAEVKKIIDRTDVYYATAKDLSTRKLMVNGKEIEVEVLTIQSWFGEFTVLNNPQNPLVLEFKSTLPPKTLDGFLDFRIEELKELQE
jgi:hypothetical protein